MSDEGIFTKKFWKDAAERGVRAFAVSLVAVFTASTTTSIDWKRQAFVALMAAAGSIILSLAATNFGDSNNASFVKPGVTDGSAGESNPKN